jgi:hypothetical protein
VTFHKDQIQALINEIDSVLDKPSPRLLSAMAGGNDQQRLVLEQTRSYLSSLQRDLAATESPGLAASAMIPFPEQASAESAQQVLQAVLQEMSYLRTNFMQPLRQDVEGLQQQREALVQEIRQLETQRQQYALPQQTINQQQLINEFLQSLMGRLQENLTGQVAQMLTGLEAQTLQERSLMAGSLEAGATPTDLQYQSVLTPRQRLEQIQMLQSQSDQLLLKLDSTLGVIFESLQSNIQSYQESLTQGLDKMHSLGQQGEAMFAALVNRLAQQLGREASTYLQSSIQTTDWEAANSLPQPSTYIPPQATSGTSFPGEVPLSPQASPSEEISDEQIDLLLNELTVGESATVIQLPDDEDVDLDLALDLGLLGTSEAPVAAEPLPADSLATSASDLDTLNSELDGLQLSTAALGDIDVDDDITFFQVDQPLTSFQLEDDDFSRLQTDLELATSDAVESVAETEEEIDDIDSALDLLTQLSAELQTEPTEPPALNPALNSASVTAEEAIASSQERYDDEMSDLYQTLFGEGAEGRSDNLDDDLADQHVADANLTAEPPAPPLTSEISEMAATALGDELFGGLADPAQPIEAIAPPDDSSAELADLDAMLPEGLFAGDDGATPAAPVAGDIAGDIDTISSLADLIESPLPTDDTDLTDVLHSEPTTAASEDTFIPAALDEVLLVPGEGDREPSRSISLDEDTINQLTADLSSLEGLETSPVSYQDADLELREGAWTLDDLNRQPDETIAPLPEPFSLEDDITELIAPEPAFPDFPELHSEAPPAETVGMVREDLISSPIDHPLPFDLDESSEITEIIEPGEAIAPPSIASSAAASDLLTSDQPFFFEEHDELDLDNPTDLDDLFEQLASEADDSYADDDLSIPPASSPAPADTSQALPMDQLDQQAIEGEDLALDDLFLSLGAPSIADAEEPEEASGLTLGEFGASLDAFSDVADPQNAEELFSDELFLDEVFSGASLDPSPGAEETPLSELSLDEFSEALPLPLMPPLPNGPPVSAALHASDMAAPPPPIPLDDDATIEDFFAAATPLEPSSLESLLESSEAVPIAADSPEPVAVPPTDEEEINAFTLEGMVDLFEDAPSIELSGWNQATDPQPPGEDTEKKKTLTPEPLTGTDDADVSGLDWVERLVANQPDVVASPDVNESIGVSDTWLSSLGLDPSAAVEAPPGLSSTDLPLAESASAPVADPLPTESSPAESTSTELPLTQLTSADAPPADSIPVGFSSTESLLLPSEELPLEELGYEELSYEELSYGESGYEELTYEESGYEELTYEELEESASIDPGIIESLLEAFPAEEPQQEAIAEDATIDNRETVQAEDDTAGLLDDESPAVGDRAFFPDSTSEMLAVSEELGIDPRELEALLDSDFATDDFFPPLPPPPPDTLPKVWYLGLDLGTTGISAVLLNRLSGELHPIYWSYGTSSRADLGSGGGGETLFRLPTRVYLATDEQAIAPSDVAPGFVPQGNLVQVSFVLPGRSSEAAPGSAADTTPSDFLLHDFKPYLKVGIPYYSPETSCWEPVLQWSDHQQISLSPVHQALRVLTTTLSPAPTTPTAAGMPQCGAIGLDDGALQGALSQLAGVIVGCPVNWPDTYGFNVREAVLGAHLVTYPDQIFVVEDVIATLLSGLRSADGRSLVLPNGLAQKPNLHNADWQGATLVINAGATATDLAVVDLPESLSSLSYPDFHLRSLAVAGNAMDQDIVCQLIYPAWLDQVHGTPDPANASTLSYTFGTNGARPSSSDSGLQSSYTSDQIGAADLDRLGLSNLPLPLPGEPDVQTRFRLQQRLENSALGQALLEAARYVKLNLQQQDQLMLKLGDRHLVVTRQDLGSRVFLPFIQRLNREINGLLSQTNVSPMAVQQVICTGGTASLGAIARWLREKFPNATIIQDTYSGNRASSPQDNCLPTCSRVAYGLATLPLHPQVPDLPRQQYSDYFLLLEILRIFPDEPLSAGEIMQRLERRGINTEACYAHILALLEGHLPPGLVPTAKDSYLLTAESRENPDYQVLLAAPLFHKQNNQTYRPNYEQWNHFRRYLSTVMASTYQKLTEPLSVSLIS